MYAKIIDEKTRACIVGTGTNVAYYISLGMSEMDVERGYDGLWYEKGYAPSEPLEVVLGKAKSKRDGEVSRISVEVDGMTFDGDETSQNRMARKVLSAQLSGIQMSEKTDWVLADNTIASVSYEQLAKACALAGQKQSELWVKPYEI